MVSPANAGCFRISNPLDIFQKSGSFFGTAFFLDCAHAVVATRGCAARPLQNRMAGPQKLQRPQLGVPHRETSAVCKHHRHTRFV